MSREALDESMSAVMDGEAGELELRRVLAAAGEDAQARARWARYQLARDVMHRQSVLPGLDLSAAVAAAIDAEPAAAAAPVAAPRARGWQRLGRFAVAASVTLAVLAGVRWYHQDEALQAPQLAQQAAPAVQPALPVVTAPQAPAVLASFPAESAETARTPVPADEAQIIRELPPQPAAGDAASR